MHFLKNKPFLLLVVISICNIFAAYKFGNNGYEAFITVAVALGIYATWLLFQALARIWRSKRWAAIKIIYSVILILYWLFVVFLALFSVSRNAHDPAIMTPPVNWLIVAIGTVPYLLPRIYQSTNNIKFNDVAVSWVTILYSDLVLFAAMLAFFDVTAKFGSIMLVIAIQLQYLMNHLASKTNYIERASLIASKIKQGLHVQNSEYGQFIDLLLVGFPFIVPIVTVMVVGVIR